MNRKEMIQQLEQYKMSNGRYDVAAVIAAENAEMDSLDLTFAAFFGDDDEQNPDGESELVTLARELNEEMAQADNEKNQAEITQLVNELQTATGRQANRVYNRLEELGAGRWTGDSDNLVFVFNQRVSNQYADQIFETA